MIFIESIIIKVLIYHLKDFCEKRHPDYILSEEVLKNSVLNITISIDIENDGMMKNKI